MKRKGWKGFLIGIVFCLLVVLPASVQASLFIQGDYGGDGTILLNYENSPAGSGYFWDYTLNKDAYIAANTDLDGLAGNSNGWRVFNDGGEVYNSSFSGLIFGYPYNLMSGSLYNNSGYIEGTNGVKMGAGTVTNGGGIYGDSEYGIYQYSEGASTFSVTNGVYIPLTVTFDPDTNAMTVTPGTPETTGIGTIAGYGGGIYSYIGGAGSASVDNAGLIIGYGGAGVGLYGNGTSTATVTNTGTIYGGYGGYGYAGVDIDGVLTATVTNSGNIEGDDEGVRIANSNTGSVTNNTGATIRGYEGVDFYEVGSVTVDNSGTISGRYGVDVNHADTVNITNNAGGTIRGQYGIDIDDAGTVDITNAGMIRGQYGIYVDESGDVKITNNAGGTIRGEYGVYVENTDSVEINNEANGLIRGGDESIYISSVGSATINNSGTIYSEDDDGIYIYGADTVSITNNAGGLIDTWDEGIEIGYGGYGGSVMVTNAGVIDAVNEGVNIYGVDTAIVDNSGTINSYDDIGVSMQYIGGITTAKVINSGTITGMVGVSILDSMTAEVINEGGTIEGYFNGVDIERVGSATVTNTGTIIGYGGFDSVGDDGDDYGYGYGYSGYPAGGGFGAYGVLAYQVDGAVNINNSGMIIGYAADGIGGDGGTADYYTYSYTTQGGAGGEGWGAIMGLGISVSEVDSVYIENSGIVIGYGGNGIGGDGGDSYNYQGSWNVYGGSGGNGIGGSFYGMGGGFGIGIYQVEGLAEVNNSGTVIGNGGNGIGGNGGDVFFDEGYYYSYAGNGGHGYGAVGYGITMMDVGSAKLTNTSDRTIAGYGGAGYGGNGGNSYYYDYPSGGYTSYGGNGGFGYGGAGYGVYITNFDVALTSASVTNSGTIVGYGGAGYGGDGGYGGYDGYGGYGFGGAGYGGYITNAQTVTVDNSGTISGIGGNGLGGYGTYEGYGGAGFGGSGYGLYIGGAQTVTVNNLDGGVISGVSGSDDLDYSFNEIQNNDDFSLGVLIAEVAGTATVNNAGTISGMTSFTGEYIDGYYGSFSYGIYGMGFGDLYIDEFYFEDLHGSYDIDSIDMPLGGGVLLANVGSAVVNNSGTIEGGLFGVAIGGYNTMDTVNVVNSGTISGVSTGVFDIDYFSAHLDNLYLDVHSSFGPFFDVAIADLDLNVEYLDATLDYGMGLGIVNAETVTLNNSGTIEGGMLGVGIALADTVNVTNSGTIKGVGHGNIKFEDLYINVYGGMEDKSIDDDDDMSTGLELDYGIGLGVFGAGTVTVNNSSSGTIEGGMLGVGIADFDSATVNNYGTITAMGQGTMTIYDYYGEDSNYIANMDYGIGIGLYGNSLTSLLAEGMSIIYYSPFGYYMFGDVLDIDYIPPVELTSTATVNNYGAINASLMGIGIADVASADVTNSGDITVTGNAEGIGVLGFDGFYDGMPGMPGLGIPAYGISIMNVLSSTVNNSGTITATAGNIGWGGNGAPGDGPGNGGAGIGGNAFGIYIDTNYYLAYIGDDDDDSVEPRIVSDDDDDDDSAPVSVSVTNSGTITATASKGMGGDGGSGYDYNTYGGNGGAGIGGEAFGVYVGPIIMPEFYEIGANVSSQMEELIFGEMLAEVEVTNTGSITATGADGYGGKGGRGYGGYWGGEGGYAVGGDGTGIAVWNADTVKISNSSAETINAYGGNAYGGIGGKGYNGSYGGIGGEAWGGDAYGIDVWMVGSTIDVNNSGTINTVGGNAFGGNGREADLGGFGGDGYGGYATGIYAGGNYYDGSNTTTIINASGGVINATGGNGYGGNGGYSNLGVGGNGDDGYGGDAYGIEVHYGKATVENYGTINVTGGNGYKGLAADGYGGYGYDGFAYGGFARGIYICSCVDEAIVKNYGIINAVGGTGEDGDGYGLAIDVEGSNKSVTLGTGSQITGYVVADPTGDNNNIILEAAAAVDYNEMNASQIDGFGTMEKTGPGTWVLNGDKDFNWAYNTETESYDIEHPMSLTVSEGVLAVNNRGADGGNGITVASYTQTNGKLGYIVTPDQVTVGQMNVTGDADFNNGEVTVIAVPTPENGGQFAVNTVYPGVLTVGGTIYNPWTEVTDNSAFLTAELVENGDQIYDLILNRLSFTTGADDSTMPLAQLLDELYVTTDDPELLALLNEILLLTSEGEAGLTLAELSGGSHTAFQTLSFYGLDKYLGILNNHMSGMGGFGGFAGYNPGVGFASNGTQLAMAGSGDSISDVAPMLLAAVSNVINQGQAAKGTNWGLWADGYLGTGNRRSDELIAKYKQKLFGGIIGFDYRVADDVYVGISGGISRTNVEFDDLLDEGHMDSYQASLYMAYNGKPWYAAGVFTYAYNKYNLDRYITTLGPTLVANSDYSGNEYTGYAEVGYKIEAGNVQIRPLVGFQIDYLEQKAFTETGAGSYNLYVDKEETGSYQSFLGVNVTGNIKLSETAALRPELRLKWAHEFSNDDHMIKAQFDGMSSSSFTVAAEKLSRDTAIIGVGMSLLFNKHVGAYIQYDAELNSDFVNHTGLLGVRLAW